MEKLVVFQWLELLSVTGKRLKIKILSVPMTLCVFVLGKTSQLRNKHCQMRVSGSSGPCRNSEMGVCSFPDPDKEKGKKAPVRKGGGRAGSRHQS